MKKIVSCAIALAIGVSVNLTHPGGFAAELQDHSMMHRGEMVMGFDQEKTTHHFYLYEDGGSIEVTANSNDDLVNRAAIRDHLPHIVQMFANGDFNAPMEVHAQQVPGTAELAKLKDKVSYKYIELPRGGHADIFTADPAALRAVHEFLRFQIKDHKTGDSTDVTKRTASKRP